MNRTGLKRIAVSWDKANASWLVEMDTNPESRLRTYRVTNRESALIKAGKLAGRYGISMIEITNSDGSHSEFELWGEQVNKRS